MQDIFTLAKIEKQAAAERINKALVDIRNKRICMIMAETLYNSWYAPLRLKEDRIDKGEVLDELCQTIFGCSAEEVVKAYDKRLN